jgi:hypothetical protein
MAAKLRGNGIYCSNYVIVVSHQAPLVCGLATHSERDFAQSAKSGGFREKLSIWLN